MDRINHNHRTRHGFRVLVSLMAIIFILLMLGLLAAGFWMTVYLGANYEDSVDVSLFAATARGGSTKVYCYDFSDRASRTGELMELTGEQLYGSGSCIYVAYDAVPQNLIDAFVAIEDKRFFSHSGVDWQRTALAVYNYYTGAKKTFGGSTITQQVIKNITGEDEVSPERKIQEIIWALDLETKLDKTEILELYMNIVNLSHGCIGVQAAANTYFSKDVSKLSLIECAAVAAITNNPAYYDPVRHPENNKVRRDVILQQMYDQGLINDDEYNGSYGRELITDLTWYDSSDGVNSWYVDMAVEDVINDLCEEYEYSREAASMMVYSGGLRIYTAMDPDVQRVLDEYYKNTENFPLTGNSNEFQSSMIVIDPYTGDILGVAGAIGEKIANRVQNYATMTLRPSGSTIKPLSVYAPALEAGIITSASVYDDVPVLFKVNDTGEIAGWPKNSPAVYRGLTNILTAVQESVNTIAVRVLEDLGEKESFDFLTEKAGLDSLIGRKRLDDGTVISDIGAASLALGQQNYGVTVRELSTAYTMFANSGVVSNTRSYIKVTDAAGNILLVNDYEGTRAVSTDTASLITLMLENVVSQGTAKSVTLDKYVNVAGKTGTTQDNYDKWFIGYTPYYLGGVWCGHEYPASLDGIAGNPCIKVWDEIMTILHDKFVSGAEVPVGFDISGNIVKVKVCADSGKLLSSACRADPRGDRGVYCWFVAGKEPTEFCDCHVMVNYDIVGGGVAGPYCPAVNLKQVGMIQTERSFPVQIYVTDAQYVWRSLPAGVEPAILWNVPFFSNMLRSGEYCGISNTTSQFNKYCALHYKKEEAGTTTKPHINWFWPTG